MLSILIPARDEPYLQHTIDDIFSKARGDIEVIAVLDGYWPSPPLKDHPRLVQVHNSKPIGMRGSINAAARIAQSKFILKCDAHCLFAEGFDEVLSNDCEHDWTLVPVRYGLDAEKWERVDKKKFEFQYIRQYDLKGKNWPEYAERVKNGHKLVDLMTTQGSCWFMHRKRFWELGGLDDENYGAMGKEAQEVCLKTWLSGGRFVLDRNTWYAHWSKPVGMYSDMRSEKHKSAEHVVKYWKGNDLPYKRDLDWLVRKFEPVPTWEPRPVKPDVCPINSEVQLVRPIRKSIGITMLEGFNRSKLYRYFAYLGFKVGAEVGVQRGRNAWLILENIPDVKLFLIDPYQDNPDTKRKWGDRQHNKAKRLARNRLRNRNVEFIEKTSLEASRDFEDGSLDFVYIDGEHSYRYVMLDIILWYNKVRKGGIVSGHDYYYMKKGKMKVEDAVNDFVSVHKLKLTITDRGKNVAEHYGDRFASWFFVK